jgi:hypothetical protein
MQRISSISLRTTILSIFILREAREQQEAEIQPPKQKITDERERAHGLSFPKAEGIRRPDQESEREHERVDEIRSVEESHKDFASALSVWERAVQVEIDYQNPTRMERDNVQARVRCLRSHSECPEEDSN